MAGLFTAGASKMVVRTKTLTLLESATLDRALLSDAADSYYSAWVSFIDALRGIQCHCYTWSTVKLYYSTFYSLRSALALAKICAFHVGNFSFSVKALPNQAPVSCTEKGTHKTVMKTFEREHAGHLLVSQQIDLQDALDWLMTKRGKVASYRQTRFKDPDAPPEFSFVASKKGSAESAQLVPRRDDPSHVFDPQHALLAYPLKALQMVGEMLRFQCVVWIGRFAGGEARGWGCRRMMRSKCLRSARARRGFWRRNPQVVEAVHQLPEVDLQISEAHLQLPEVDLQLLGGRPPARRGRPRAPGGAPPALRGRPPVSGEAPPTPGGGPPAPGGAPPIAREAPPAVGVAPPAAREPPPNLGAAPPALRPPAKAAGSHRPGAAWSRREDLESPQGLRTGKSAATVQP